MCVLSSFGCVLRVFLCPPTELDGELVPTDEPDLHLISDHTHNRNFRSRETTPINGKSPAASLPEKSVEEVKGREVDVRG